MLMNAMDSMFRQAIDTTIFFLWHAARQILTHTAVTDRLRRQQEGQLSNNQSRRADVVKEANEDVWDMLTTV